MRWFESNRRHVFYEIWSYVALALGTAMCGVVLYFLVRGDGDDRAKEEAAREYFDAHGHWPDEA